MWSCLGLQHFMNTIRSIIKYTSTADNLLYCIAFWQTWSKSKPSIFFYIQDYISELIISDFWDNGHLREDNMKFPRFPVVPHSVVKLLGRSSWSTFLNGNISRFRRVSFSFFTRLDYNYYEALFVKQTFVHILVVAWKEHLYVTITLPCFPDVVTTSVNELNNSSFRNYLNNYHISAVWQNITQLYNAFLMTAASSLLIICLVQCHCWFQ
jgi:hypothetical protein